MVLVFWSFTPSCLGAVGGCSPDVPYRWRYLHGSSLIIQATWASQLCPLSWVALHARECVCVQAAFFSFHLCVCTIWTFALGICIKRQRDESKRASERVTRGRQRNTQKKRATPHTHTHKIDDPRGPPGQTDSSSKLLPSLLLLFFHLLTSWRWPTDYLKSWFKY